MFRTQHEYRKDSWAVARTDQVFIIFLYLPRFIKLDKVSPTPPFFPGSISLLTSISSLRQHRGMRIRSCGHPKMLHFSHSCSSMVFLPQQPALHELLQCGSFLFWACSWRTAPVWVLCRGCSPSGMDWCSRVPAGSQVLPEDLCQPGLLPMGCLWAVVSFRAPASAVAWALYWLQGGYLLHHGSPWAEGRQLTLLWSSPQAARNLCSDTWTTSSPSFFILVSTELFLSFSPHSSLTAAPQLFLPFLIIFITEAPPASLMGSALSSGRFTLENLEQALWDTGMAPDVISEKPPLQLLHYQILAT